jgi:HTH-type transcriptional regulator/antitoxin HigA
MNWKVIKTKEEHKKAITRIIEIFHAEPNTPEDDELGVLALLIKDYEDKHHPIPELDALEVVKIKMKEMGLKNKDLEPIIGSKGHVSAILLGKREIYLKNGSKA